MRAARMLLFLTLVFVMFATARETRPLANEAAAIGRIRAMHAAQGTLASVSGGWFGTWECLNAPGCLRSGPVAGGFISPDASAPERGGYRFELITSETREAETLSGRHAVARFALIAQPLDAATRRAFCGDDTGQIFVVQGQRPAVRDGRCDDRSVPLQ